MPLVSSRELLAKAREGRYAIGALGVDFRRLFAPAREAVKERIREKMRLFGASGQAAA